MIVDPRASHVGLDALSDDDDLDSVRISMGYDNRDAAAAANEIESTVRTNAQSSSHAALSGLERELAELEQMRAQYDDRIAREDTILRDLFQQLS